MKYPIRLAVFAAILLLAGTIHADLGRLTALKLSKDSLLQKAKAATGVQQIEEKKQGIVNDAKVTEVNQLPKSSADVGAMVKTSAKESVGDVKDDAHKAAEEKTKLKLGL